MSAPSQNPGAVNTSISSLGKRKKSGKSSYLGTWLERASRHIQQEPEYEYPPNPYSTLDPYRVNGYYPPEAVSLSAYPVYAPPQIPGPFWPQDCRAHKSVQVQRPRVKRSQNGVTNGYTAPKYEDNSEYTSLPPIVTSVGDTASNSEANDKESGSARRFSDPCLPRLEEPGSEGDGEASTCEASDSKLLMCLVDQINALKLANDRLNRDLQETRAELQTVRQQASLWQKGSASSMGPPNHGPLSNNGYAHYTPGALAELVREIRDAARLREEALYARVRSLVDDRALNQGGIPCSLGKTPDSRNYEDIKSSLRAAEADKRRLSERVSRLEEDLRHVKTANGIPEAGESELERTRREASEARRELLEARRAKEQAEDHTLRLERLVTQLRSCKMTNGPAAELCGSPSSDLEESPVRVRRSSTNSSTIVFGPVTDL